MSAYRLLNAFIIEPFYFALFLKKVLHFKNVLLSLLYNNSETQKHKTMKQKYVNGCADCPFKQYQQSVHFKDGAYQCNHPESIGYLYACTGKGERWEKCPLEKGPVQVILTVNTRKKNTPTPHPDYAYNDGGRSEAGYKGTAGDCFARAASIVTGKPYKEVYDRINAIAKGERTGKRKEGRSNARTGVYRYTEEKFMRENGFVRVACMQVGKGTVVTLDPAQLPKTGRILVCVSRHYTALVKGQIQDTYDPRRYEEETGRPTRAVYAYWYHPNETTDPVFPL